MTAFTSEAPSTLAGLVSPLTEVEFLELLRRRELVYRPGGNGERYAPLLGWPALRRMIEAGNYPDKRPDDIRVTKESSVVTADRWTTNGKVDAAKLEAFLAAGFSVVILHLEEHVPALGAVCEEIKTRTLEGSFVGAVVTSGAGAGAFRVHYDPEDLVILQVEGTKRWQIFGPPVRNPVIGTPKVPPPPEESPIFDEVLQPGDVLFVPAGNWHHCQNGPGRSLHLGIFFIAPTVVDLLRDVTLKLIEDEMFRTPLSRLENPTLASLEDDVKRHLIDRVNQMDLREFVSKWIAS